MAEVRYCLTCTGAYSRPMSIGPSGLPATPWMWVCGCGAKVSATEEEYAAAHEPSQRGPVSKEMERMALEVSVERAWQGGVFGTDRQKFEDFKKALLEQEDARQEVQAGSYKERQPSFQGLKLSKVCIEHSVTYPADEECPECVLSVSGSTSVTRGEPDVESEKKFTDAYARIYGETVKDARRRLEEDLVTVEPMPIPSVSVTKEELMEKYGPAPATCPACGEETSHVPNGMFCRGKP